MRLIRHNRERRDDGRRPVQWTGRFGAPGTFGIGWTPCAIDDISAHGASVIVDGDASVGVGELVSLDVERVGATSVGLRVVGHVRHVETAADGTTTFGVQLEFASPQERRTAQEIFSGWSRDQSS